jgi:opacity protein-like surface antigen
MDRRTPARSFSSFVLTAATAVTFATTAPLAAQPGSGNGFLFRPPAASLTFYGGLAAPAASGGVHALATRELTVDRSDFQSGAFGFDLAVSVRPRLEIVASVEKSRSANASEYRDWVDNNDQPIEQVTRFERMPITVSARYYLADRGRRIGSVAWIPASLVPFVSAGIGTVGYTYEQVGDFVDEETLNVFSARLRSRGWTAALQGGAGLQWSLSPRLLVTGDLRYLHASGDGDAPNADFAGYRVNLSGVSSMVGLTLRF